MAKVKTSISEQYKAEKKRFENRKDKINIDQELLNKTQDLIEQGVQSVLDFGNEDG